MKYLLILFLLLFTGCGSNKNIENVQVSNSLFKIKKSGFYVLNSDYQFCRLQAISIARDNLVNFLVKKLNFLSPNDLEKVKNFIYLQSNIEKIYKNKNKIFAIVYIDKVVLKNYILKLNKNYEQQLNEVIK